MNPKTDPAIRTPGLIRVLEVLVGLLEVDDRHFGGFTSQVTRLAEAVARTMEIDPDGIEEIVIASLLRDVGKVGVRREILEDEDRFSSEDARHVQQHVEWSLRLFEHIPFGGRILPIIRHHHERYDGTGYPDGLRGREIPLGARIIAASEGFAAMVAERPHRPPKEFDAAVDEMMREAGRQFDPEVVEILIRVLESSSTASLVGRRTSIVIVDPETEFRRLVRLRLLNEGFDVRAVSELTEDPGIPDDDEPCLVLADASRGQEQLFETLGKLRATERRHPIPVAVLAAEPDRALKLAALRHGIEDFISKSQDLEEITARVGNVLTRERMRRRGRTRHGSGVTGILDHLSVAEVVQMLVVGGKTAAVTLDTDARSGKIWIADGRIVHAITGAAAGDDAFFEMLRWPTGTFAIQHGVVTEHASIASDSTFLLVEGLRRIDDRAREEPAATPIAPVPFPTRRDEPAEAGSQDPATDGSGGEIPLELDLDRLFDEGPGGPSSAEAPSSSAEPASTNAARRAVSGPAQGGPDGATDADDDDAERRRRLTIIRPDSESES